jgi:sec-independent protein translocase protein TatA
MAIQGIEWVVIGVIIIILFLWGPEKLPKMARSLGQARREFEKASKGLEEELNKASSIARPSLAEASTPPADKLLEVARSLGVSTEGKTREEIVKEIGEKLQKTA